MISGNKGEWSEVYTLLKIISDKFLFSGDEDINKIEDLFFPIIKILRDETNGTFEFSYDQDIVIIKEGKEEHRLPIVLFHENAKHLLAEIKASKKSSFNIPKIEEFISSFNSSSLKASSSTKSDIRIVIHDKRTSTESELGFSIKSQLGGASTLLNAGKTTNFIYKIEGIKASKDFIKSVNSIDSKHKIKDRIDCILNKQGVLKYHKTECQTFENNLTLIDSSLSKIVSEMLMYYYTSNKSRLIEILETITIMNPLGYNLSFNHPFYEYKIKRFLTDIALGMMPSKVWTGELDATGGYLVVKDNGDVVCYHIYNRNEFENYLLKNTKFETASSTRHDFGKIQEIEGELIFKLNLQIRFIK